jgi:hypothetical protein
MLLEGAAFIKIKDARAQTKSPLRQSKRAF